MDLEKFHNIGTTADWIVMVVYFIAIMLFGTYFGRYNRSTKDFFFGGRRFAWWLIAFSIVATGVGSHSFIKYSAKGFEAGFSSSMTYINDWFFVPFFLFGWLPIIIYTKIRSIPEYFEKRFSPSARFLATILLLFYMIGYISIGFLTLGKAILPMLPTDFTLLGVHFEVTLMGVVMVIAVVTGIYITFGGQTAVIFTDLLQGFILLFAGFLIFFIGISYIGGFDIFWNMLPTEWKLPLAHFNEPSSFNFVGIFWQDGVAGSIGFLFMNMGLIMRFMATKSVDEGRKAATFNILFMLPLSAIVVSNAGWVGKAISVEFPDIIPPNTDPDQIFVVVANVIAHPGVFGFVMAALTAALMSTVDTLINATAAIYINDVHRPIKKVLKHLKEDDKITDRKELFSARVASVVVTSLGVIGVLAFRDFPTVYEAHGFFHSTLTPPLVIAIFMGLFWRKFTPAAVIVTFIGGVALMILGANYPGILIKPFAHGTPMDESHPFSYIRALYNLFVCFGVGFITALTTSYQQRFVAWIKSKKSDKEIIYSLLVICIVLFVGVVFSSSLIVLHPDSIFEISLFLFATLLMSALVTILVTYFVKYDPEMNTLGLTVYSLKKAKEMFKGSKINDREGEKIVVNWKLKDTDEDIIYFSKNDMKRMEADPGDLVYLTDVRKWMGGLKSVHSVFGEPHDEDGVVYITRENFEQGQFVEGKKLQAEKEM
ncbi:MAG TPA: sodium:solute symporter family protein [Ignavibacteriaceae bacterium]|nr:sodium:solute symporter family protein [Ignavibacteriaceae bacterium]